MLVTQRGVTLLEVLITIVVAAFGILGLASLQAKMHISSMEAYQRAQAVILTNDMVSRLDLNRQNTAAYITGANAPLGTGDDQPADCSALADAARDLCEWSNALKGAAELVGAGDAAENLGAMIDARGCVEQLQAANLGTCSPEVLRVTTTWQGLVETEEPLVGCAADDYDGLRRAVTARLIIGLPACQ